MSAQNPLALPNYRVIQLEWSQRTGARNASVEDFEGLVTHHPQTNRNARVVDGAVVGGQDGRAFGVVGGEIQEIEVAREERTFGLTPHRVLLKKDFILEDSRLATGPGSRAVDVPSPVSGVIGHVHAASGRVDVLDRAGGEVIARVRHMSPLLVEEGDVIEYGQALGVQGMQMTGAIHVHMEVDTRYFVQYQNYLEDLVVGRLAIDSGRREIGIQAREAVDDGTLRIGESSVNLRDVQRRLNDAGYTGADGQPLAEDGVYRLSMQRAVINFQEANGLPPTGDLDPATMRTIAPPMFPPEVNPRMPDQQPPYVPLQGQADVSSAAAQNPLLAQSRDAMHRLEATLGREFDHNSERMAASAACLAKDSGLSRVDHVLLSNATETKRQGETFFVVQGDPANPAHRRAHMPTEQALNAPLEQSLQRLQGVDAPAQAQTQSQQREQNEQLVQQAQQPHQMG